MGINKVIEIKLKSNDGKAGISMIDRKLNQRITLLREKVKVIVAIRLKENNEEETNNEEDRE